MIVPSSDFTPNEFPPVDPDASAVTLPPTSLIELSAEITDSPSPSPDDFASTEPPVISTSDADIAEDTESMLLLPPAIFTVPADSIPLPSDFICMLSISRFPSVLIADAPGVVADILEDVSFPDTFTSAALLLSLTHVIPSAILFSPLTFMTNVSELPGRTVIFFTVALSTVIPLAFPVSTITSSPFPVIV